MIKAIKFKVSFRGKGIWLKGGMSALLGAISVGEEKSELTLGWKE